MADSEEIDEDIPETSNKKPLIMGLILALLGGGGGFYASSSGLILGPKTESAQSEEKEAPSEGPLIAFVELDPVMVNMQTDPILKHLRFRAQLEVPIQHQENVALLRPRVTDVLNGYLRALDSSDIEDPLALVRIRSQLLRRIQIVTGKGMVNDLLVMEFVIT
ncbi:MAG: flagellar basal body-associated protein FliL [Halioglobus sp.]